MASTPAVCTACQTPLPAEAEFCPHCGTRTPTQISSGGTASVAMPPDQLSDQQARLQAALGPDYAVERLLGSGGFATVWAAFDRKLQREVAIKVLHPDLVATRSLLERFQREAQAVARLRHPGVIPIYAVGEHEGVAFYIMPLVEGESLRERLNREGALPPDEARRILREAAAALAVAHRAGIVHRDIKPENLMLEGADGRVVLMDFGIAKSTAGTGAQTGLTGTGMIIGTPTYMSPEQAKGSKEIDVRSDVYSLGVVGFEMLAGRPPFKAASVPDLILEHVATAAPSVASVRPDTPQDLAIAVNRSLQKDPKERWRNGGDLTAFLERVSTPAAQAAAVSKDLRRFDQRRWRPSGRQIFWTVAGIILLTLVVTFGASLGDLRVSYYYWAAKVGLIKPPRLQELQGRGAQFASLSRLSPWAVVNVGANAGVQSMGGTYLAVSETRNFLFALHLFDGQTWRSFRTPEPIGAVATVGKDLLLFGGSTGGHMYRWSPAGIALEDTIPFGAQAAWADERAAVLVGVQGGQLATRDARGWRRMASLRRNPLLAVAGIGANDLAAIGSFGHPDSIVEYDGTSWETVDPRPPGVKGTWGYDGIATLGDRSLAVGGRDPGDDKPLLLIRSSRGHWRRIPLTTDSAATVKDIQGIWGTGAEDLFVWNPACEECRLGEISHGELHEAVAMGRGRLLGVAQAGGTLYAVWADGTVWARRNGRWVFVTEVPNTVVSYAAAVNRPGVQSFLRFGEGHLGYVLGDGQRECSAGPVPGALDSVPAEGRGVAIGRGMAWVLGADGVVRRVGCGTGAWKVTREALTGGLALAQRRRGGALLLGEHGLLARCNDLGVWTRLRVPAAMAGESLFSGDESADGHVAVLGSHHLAILDSLGRSVRIETLTGLARPIGVALTDRGYAALVYRDQASIERSDGSVAGVATSFGGNPITSWLVLSDGRLVFGLGGDAGDPFATGGLLVTAIDTSGLHSATIGVERQRSRVTAMFERDENLVVYTASGVYNRNIHDLPFLEAKGRSGP